jgi:hypothetical protein
MKATPVNVSRSLRSTWFIIMSGLFRFSYPLTRYNLVHVLLAGIGAMALVDSHTVLSANGPRLQSLLQSESCESRHSEMPTIALE